MDNIFFEIMYKSESKLTCRTEENDIHIRQYHAERIM